MYSTALRDVSVHNGKCATRRPLFGVGVVLDPSLDGVALLEPAFGFLHFIEGVKIARSANPDQFCNGSTR